jgi:hypothetical protein
MERDKEWLKEDGVWSCFGLSKPWLRKSRQTGDGPPFYRVGRMIYYRRSELEAFMKSRRVDRCALLAQSVEAHDAGDSVGR